MFMQFIGMVVREVAYCNNSKRRMVSINETNLRLLECFEREIHS